MIKIRNNFIFSNNHRPIIIAEVSANHCGSKKLFLKLIEKAHFAGADAVKIQSYEPGQHSSTNLHSHIRRHVGRVGIDWG